MSFKPPLPRGERSEIGNDKENLRGKTIIGKRSSTPTRSAGVAGAVTEDEIRKSFGDAPKIQITSKDELEMQLQNSRVILEKTANDWSKRSNSLKIIRAVVLNGGLDYETDLISSLLTMEDALTKSVIDLRSQVCKEACITLCLLAEQLGNKVSRFFERIFPHCIPLIQNSAKVMSTSSQHACDFIVKNVHSPRILQSILDATLHKSKEIRSHCYSLICLALEYWPTDKFDKQIKDVINAIKNGISDADPTARKHGRNCYQQLEISFPSQAQSLFKSLDASKQKTLLGGGSAASSTHSILSLRDSLPIALTRRPSSMGFTKPLSPVKSRRTVSSIDTTSIRAAIPTTPIVITPKQLILPITPAPNRTPASLYNRSSSKIMLIKKQLQELVMARTNPQSNDSEKQVMCQLLTMVRDLLDTCDDEQIRPFLKDFAPDLVQCYTCADPLVRKNTIYCLITLVNKFGRETMDQFLMNMELKGLRLLELYLLREQRAASTSI